MKQFFNKYWFIVACMLIITYAIYGGGVDETAKLSGVQQEAEYISCTFHTLMDGSYQAYLNNKWENHFPGRSLLIKIRNQFLFTICRESPNTHVVIGKEGYLFEPEYIYNELLFYETQPDEYFIALADKLVRLQDILEKYDKELYVFVTPSKAHFEKDKIPQRYLQLDRSDGAITNYQKMCKVFNEKGILFFDAIQYCEENREKFKAPYFYKTGIHWSHVWGESAAAEFLKYINKNSRFDIAELSIDEIESETPIYPDTDLYDSMNLLEKATGKYYGTNVKIEMAGKDKPNVFLRGGSFMGQSLNMLLASDVFGQDVHLENNYYFTNKYTSQAFLTNHGAYDEMNLDVLLGQSDIVILEVNDLAISGMSWGFIDYCLEHPEYLDREYLEGN